MPRSVLTLAAAATAAVPGLEVTRVQELTAGGEGRCDAAVATLDDGQQIAVRVPATEQAERELAAEAVVLRALTSGVREILPFAVPVLLGTAPFDGSVAYVSRFIRGYLVDAADLPRGPGAATSIGKALAELHALPPTIVRAAGLPVRTPEESRSEVERVLETAAASRRVPVRLIVRWREALEDERLWAFESTVSLGGTQAGSFVLSDDLRGEPHVAGVLDWHGLSVDDPAVDLRWVASAPEAADDVFAAYARQAHRAPDAALRVRARLHAELEFARWLVHGLETHAENVVDDAAGLLESLSESIRDDRLLAPLGADSSDVDDALDAIGLVPETTQNGVDTSMQTDAYDPAELGLLAEGGWDDDAATGRPTDPPDTETAPDIRLPSAQQADTDDPATVPLDMDEFIARERER